jgi:hypothetical protein
LNVYDGTMWGCGLEANVHEHFLWALAGWSAAILGLGGCT